MQTFIDNALKKFIDSCDNISDAVLVFPSKRAAAVFTHSLKKSISKTTFLPKIISIESFLEELSGLSLISSTDLLFTSYQAYLNTQSFKKKDDFLTFCSWFPIIINDFNEIDRYLVPNQSIFSYLTSIQELNHWTKTENKTELIENYLQFWKALPHFYQELHQRLLQSNSGYQGMVSRKAAEDIEHYISHTTKTPHYFIGFNALTKAEELIFQELLEVGKTTVLWDIDNYFIQDREHSASSFMNTIFTRWKYYQTHTPEMITYNYEKNKEITIVEASKNISQVKYIGDLVSNYSDKKLYNTVIVLADEKLLTPLLFSLPDNVTEVNITMGLSLKNLPVYNFFKTLLDLKQNTKEDNIYYKDLLRLLYHPLINFFVDNPKEIIQQVKTFNLTFISNKQVLSSIKVKRPSAEILFTNWEDIEVINNILTIIDFLKTQNLSSLNLSTLFEINTIITTIQKSEEIIDYSVSVVSQLFSDLAQTTKLDFKGQSTQGLQIMGMLETRVLDFETVIIASVNEGILPAGNTSNSYLPYDVKKEFGLPLDSEKDTVFAYHFYRLLHRAKDITLLYNGVSDGLNTAEKSRFIHQIEQQKIPQHSINHIVLSPKINILIQQPITIDKTKQVEVRLNELAQTGFSPSALINYIRNPIDFYNQSVLEVQETQQVEEDIASNTFGSIVHDTLENLYKPAIDVKLTETLLQEIKKDVHAETIKNFIRFFPENSIKFGKNRLVFEVIKRYITNFINLEIEQIKQGNTIVILQLESNLTHSMFVKELGTEVHFKGKIDRLDLFNNEYRIIDYKTGKVEPSQLKIYDFSEIITDYKYSKVFQVLMYAWMIYSEKTFLRAQAGIVSFKSLKNGFMPFAKKESLSSRKTHDWVTKEILDMFQEQLSKLLIEIFNKEIPFIEKETK